MSFSEDSPRRTSLAGNDSPERWSPLKENPDNMFPMFRRVAEERIESNACTHLAMLRAQEKIMRGENNIWVYGRDLMDNIASFKEAAMEELETLKMTGMCDASVRFDELTWNEAVFTPSQSIFASFSRAQAPPSDSESDTEEQPHMDYQEEAPSPETSPGPDQNPRTPPSSNASPNLSWSQGMETPPAANASPNLSWSPGTHGWSQGMETPPGSNASPNLSWSPGTHGWSQGLETPPGSNASPNFSWSPDPNMTQQTPEGSPRLAGPDTTQRTPDGSPGMWITPHQPVVMKEGYVF